MLLNDSTIRNALIVKLQRLGFESIVEELRISNGSAIADIVTLRNEAHCYEIKGSTDKIERIQDQRVFYNRSFRRITLVTTENHILKAMAMAPTFWGVLVVKITAGGLRFRRIRAERVNPHFHSESALQILWKDELAKLVRHPEIDIRKQTRESLAKIIAESTKISEVSVSICTTLAHRKFGAGITSLGASKPCN